MIVHVGLRVPIPPIIISTGQHTPFFARIMHTAVYYISVRIEYLTKQCAMQRKTMCNVTEDNTKYKSSTSDSVRADDNGP